MASCRVHGADGFIGSHVVEASTEAGHRVRVFDRLRSPAKVAYLSTRPTELQHVVLDTARYAQEFDKPPLKLMSLAQGLEETWHYLVKRAKKEHQHGKHGL
jgi:UDP-glucose 4-epimerase